MVSRLTFDSDRFSSRQHYGSGGPVGHMTWNGIERDLG